MTNAETAQYIYALFYDMVARQRQQSIKDNAYLASQEAGYNAWLDGMKDLAGGGAFGNGGFNVEHAKNLAKESEAKLKKAEEALAYIVQTFISMIPESELQPQIAKSLPGYQPPEGEPKKEDPDWYKALPGYKPPAGQEPGPGWA